MKALEKEIAELKEEISERDETIDELRAEIKELKEEAKELQNQIDYFETEEEEEEPLFRNSFTGIEEIQYETTGNLLDEMMMDALCDALEVLTPQQIIERLKV